MILVTQVATFLRGRRDVVINKRTVNLQVIVRAVSIITISVLVIFLALFLLCLTEKLPFMTFLFEVVSAFGTAGLSLGGTAYLSAFGKIVIMCVMFFGKVGPLTLAFSVTRRARVDIRYPDGEIYTGEAEIKKKPGIGLLKRRICSENIMILKQSHDEKLKGPKYMSNI